MFLNVLRGSNALLAPILVTAMSGAHGCSTPATAPPACFEALEGAGRAADARAMAKCQALPGFDELRPDFIIEKASQGRINRLEESLFARLRTTDVSMLNAAWWWNPVEDGNVLFDWHVFLALFRHVDGLLGRHKWIAEWKAASPGRLLELHAFGRSLASTPFVVSTFVLPIWREAGLAGEPQYEVLARLDNHSWLRLYLNDIDPRLLLSYSTGQSPAPLHWLDGIDVSFHPKCVPGTPSSRYGTIEPSGSHEIHEYRRCAP